MQTVKIGDVLGYYGKYGRGTFQTSAVESMELTRNPRVASGVEVETVTLEDIMENRVCFSFENGRWAYSDQLELYRNNAEATTS